MSAHTPGPWVARWSEQRWAGQREPVARCVISTPPDAQRGGAAFRVCTIEGPFAGRREVAEANAALIEAAPDLLAAAEMMLAAHDIEDVRTYNAARKALRAAIAKAEVGTATRNAPCPRCGDEMGDGAPRGVCADCSDVRRSEMEVGDA